MRYICDRGRGARQCLILVLLGVLFVSVSKLLLVSTLKGEKISASVSAQQTDPTGGIAQSTLKMMPAWPWGPPLEESSGDAEPFLPSHTREFVYNYINSKLNARIASTTASANGAVTVGTPVPPASSSDGSCTTTRPSMVTMRDRAPFTEEEILALQIDDVDGQYTSRSRSFFDGSEDKIVVPSKGKCYKFDQSGNEWQADFETSMSKDSVIVVLGGGGPLGQALARELRLRGHHVHLHMSKHVTDFQDNIVPNAATNPLLEFDGMRIRVVFLLAWDTRQPSADMVAAAAKYFAGRQIPVVFPSTVQVSNSDSWFGASKLEAERLVQTSAGKYANIVRLPDVFGVERWHVGESKQHFVGKILNKCIRGDLRVTASDFKIHTGGAFRQLLYADDVATTLVNTFAPSVDFHPTALSGPVSVDGIPIVRTVTASATVGTPSSGWAEIDSVADDINVAWGRFVDSMAESDRRTEAGAESEHGPQFARRECVPASVIATLRAAAGRALNASSWDTAHVKRAAGDNPEPIPSNASLLVAPTAPLRARFEQLFAEYHKQRREHRLTASPFEKPPYLSFLTGARADNYGGTISARLQVAINHIAHFCDVYQISYELILIEWNPLPDKRVADTVEFPASMRGRVRIITVPADLVASLKCEANMLDMWAKNVGMRRARGEYLLNFIPDSLWNERIFEAFALQRLREDRLYLPYLLHSTTDIPEPTRRGGPEAIIDWMQSTTVADDKLFYDGNLSDRAKHGRNRMASTYVYWASGDFSLAHRSAVETKLRGYWETCYVRQVDSMYAWQARRKGMWYTYMDGFLYHQYHTQMKNLYFEVPGVITSAAEQTSRCAGFVVPQLFRLLDTNGDWGYRNVVFQEKVC